MKTHVPTGERTNSTQRAELCMGGVFDQVELYVILKRMTSSPSLSLSVAVEINVLIAFHQMTLSVYPVIPVMSV